MAYMNQEKKSELMPAIKQVFAAYNVKATVSVRDHMVLVVTIKSSNVLNFAPDKGVNIYHIESHYDGAKRDFLCALRDAMNNGNHNNSDIMTDYFNVGWYCDIRIGTYKKPFVFTG